MKKLFLILTVIFTLSCSKEEDISIFQTVEEYEIGSWNMTVQLEKTLYYKGFDDIMIRIQSDDEEAYSFQEGGTITMLSDRILITINDSSIFKTEAFDDERINRGTIYLIYYKPYE